MQTREYTTVGAQAAGLLGKARMAIGMTLLLAGVLIAVFPEILVILLAALVISAGLGTFLSGWRLNSRSKRAGQVVTTYRVD